MAELEAVFDKNGYPAEITLETIAHWEVKSQESIKGLIAYVNDLWHFGDWGHKLEGKQVLYWQLHTGGWSGNESIIEALQSNLLFWMMCWQKSTRGGHHWFKIRLFLFEGGQEQ